ncbi:hypothetical protein DQ238_05205 [Geodermatophilus sp. TF02-6]|nr:hypothetical protein DQ238_05205 [Geodermatophilus sp. TF02-6]
MVIAVLVLFGAVSVVRPLCRVPQPAPSRVPLRAERVVGRTGSFPVGGRGVLLQPAAVSRDSDCSGIISQCGRLRAS